MFVFISYLFHNQTIHGTKKMPWKIRFIYLDHLAMVIFKSPVKKPTRPILDALKLPILTIDSMFFFSGFLGKILDAPYWNLKLMLQLAFCLDCRIAPRHQ
jgi:hypothetical protein